MANNITHYKEQLAAAAAKYKQTEKLESRGGFLTTRGGVFRLHDEEIPGNQICAVILDSVFENTLYEGRFDPNNMAPPVCYAFARDSDDLAPHESMQAHPDIFVPQNDTCHGCPHLEWGSSDTGRGKACQQRRRLAIIPAGQFIPRGKYDFDVEIFDDEAHYENAEMALLKLPVTSVQEYGRYVHSVANEHSLPPYGVISRVWLEPDPKSQYKVMFETLDLVPDHLLPIVFQRHDLARETIITPYSPMEDREVRKTAAPRLKPTVRR
jgi:hypothetical protein